MALSARAASLALLGGGTLAVGGRLVRDLGRSATITGNSDDIVQTRLVDRRVAGVPTSDTVGVSVDDGDLDVGVLESNDSGSRATRFCLMRTYSAFAPPCIPSSPKTRSPGSKPVTFGPTVSTSPAKSKPGVKGSR